MAKELIYRLGVNTFQRETSRLGPAVVGAYIRILLDYFEQGEAPPDEDTVLARIAGCDLEMWKAIRPKLEPLFMIGTKGGGEPVRWYHGATEEEIEAAKVRKERSSKGAKAAAESHTARASADFTVQTDTDGKNVYTPVSDRAKAAAEQQLNNQRKEALEALTVPKPTVLDEPEIDDDLDDDEMIPEPPIPVAPGMNFEQPLPEEFKPSPKQIVEHMAEGYESEQIAKVVDEFRRYHSTMGTMSHNWPEMWNRWWARKKPPLHPAEKKPKPRVQVSRRAPPPPSDPQTE